MENWTHLQDIEHSRSHHLSGKIVGLAVCGSIAAIEVHRLARSLVRHGAKVQIFLTQAGCELVSPSALAWCTGREVVTELTARCEHLEYFGKQGKADLLLVAPLTANTLAKMAVGLDDNVVTTCVTTALGSDIPILVAPGMHEPMLLNPAVKRNMATIRDFGVEVLEPQVSEGKAKMLSCEQIVSRVLRCLGPQDLQGKKVLLTGGPTREFLDPARCLTNPSSGLTACYLAIEAYRRGAEVVLVYGPGQARPSPEIELIPVVSCDDMMRAVLVSIEEGEPDLFIAVAAVSDFRPLEKKEGKIPTSSGGFSLSLEPTPKILDALRSRVSGTFVVAFKAASSQSDKELVEAVAPYLNDGRADLVVGNSIVTEGLGFDSESNRYLVCAPTSEPSILGPNKKEILASELWDEILSSYSSKI